MEAKLGKIYDTLDSGNFKTACTMCLDKDVAHFDIVKSLHVFALVQLRKSSEALQIAREVISKNPTDEAVIATLSQSLKIIKKDGELLPCLENLFKLQPYNEKIAQEIFFSYCRLGDSKKMQLMAQKLFKLTTKVDYVYWSVCSMLQQYVSDPVAAGNTVLILAERMLRKILFEPTSTTGNSASLIQPGSEEFQLFIEVLRVQGKLDECLLAFDQLIPKAGDNTRVLPPPLHDETDFADNPSRIVIERLPLMLLKASLLKEKGQISEMIDVLKNILTEYPDHWTVHSLILDNLSLYAAEIGQSLSVCIENHLICLRQLQVNSKVKLRGPYLAEVKLLKQVLNTKELHSMRISVDFPFEFVAKTSYLQSSMDLLRGITGVDVFTVYVKAILNYILLFGDRLCFLGDIYPYMQTIIADSGLIDSGAGKAILILFIKTLQRMSASALQALNGISLLPVPPKLDKEKGKTSKQKGKAGKPGSSNASGTEYVQDADINSDLRNNATKLTSVFAKVKQLEFLLSCLDKNTNVFHEASGESLSSLISFDSRKERIEAYRHSLSVTSGGIGGEREVQAGDEILVLLTAAIQRKIGNQNSSMDMMKEAFTWGSMLVLGEATSPWNYIFHLENMECSRIISHVSAGIESFNKLRVKHVQVESMSYIILPCLYEYGYFTEALAQLKSIMHFHSTARHETGDQMSKSFLYANYRKCNEMFRFIELCQSSIQNALAKVEFGWLELVDKHHNSSSASAYLNQICLIRGGSCDLLEGHEIFAFDKLHDKNFDYSIMFRLDNIGLHHEGEGGINITSANTSGISWENNVRLSQMRERLLLAQLRLRILSGVLSWLTSAGDEHKNSSIEYFSQWKQICVENGLSLIGNSSSLIIRPKVRWNQHLDQGSHEFEAILLQLESTLLSLVLNKETSVSIAEIINLLNRFLLPSEGCSDKYLTGDRAFAVNPDYIRRVSGFLRNIVTYFTPIFCALLESKSFNVLRECRTLLNEEKKGAKADTSECSDIWTRSVGESIVGIVKLCNSLVKELARDEKPCSSVDQLNQNFSDVKISADPLQEERKLLSSKIQQSQQTSCSRLRNTISSKVGVLNKIVS